MWLLSSLHTSNIGQYAFKDQNENWRFWPQKTKSKKSIVTPWGRLRSLVIHKNNFSKMDTHRVIIRVNTNKRLSE